MGIGNIAKAGAKALGNGVDDVTRNITRNTDSFKPGKIDIPNVKPKPTGSHSVDFGRPPLNGLGGQPKLTTRPNVNVDFPPQKPNRIDMNPLDDFRDPNEEIALLLQSEMEKKMKSLSTRTDAEGIRSFTRGTGNESPTDSDGISSFARGNETRHGSEAGSWKDFLGTGNGSRTDSDGISSFARGNETRHGTEAGFWKDFLGTGNGSRTDSDGISSFARGNETRHGSEVGSWKDFLGTGGRK